MKEQKIAEIMCAYCEKSKIVCTAKASRKKCAGIKAILTLIEQEQKPMRELLKRIQTELTYMNEVDLSLTSEGQECLKAIDAALPIGRRR